MKDYKKNKPMEATVADVPGLYAQLYRKNKHDKDSTDLLIEFLKEHQNNPRNVPVVQFAGEYHIDGKSIASTKYFLYPRTLCFQQGVIRRKGQEFINWVIAE